MGDKWQKAKVGKYDVSGGTLVRKGDFCPRCGPGVFLANHSDRKTCGRCGYDNELENSVSESSSEQEEE